MKTMTVMMMTLMMTAPAFAKVSSAPAKKNSGARAVAWEPKSETACGRLQQVSSLMDNTNPAAKQTTKPQNSQNGRL